MVVEPGDLRQEHMERARDRETAQRRDLGRLQPGPNRVPGDDGRPLTRSVDIASMRSRAEMEERSQIGRDQRLGSPGGPTSTLSCGDVCANGTPDFYRPGTGEDVIREVEGGLTGRERDGISL